MTDSGLSPPTLFPSGLGYIAGSKVKDVAWRLASALRVSWVTAWERGSAICSLIHPLPSGTPPFKALLTLLSLRETCPHHEATY